MPAMTQQIESINKSVVTQAHYRTYESTASGNYADLMVNSDSEKKMDRQSDSEKMDRQSDSELKIGLPVHDRPQCNLTALINFMQGTAFGVGYMRVARQRKCIEVDVMYAFATYCQAIKKVDYHYFDNNSLFDLEQLIRKPNCKGRAKGFVQLLAVCGVPLKDLGLVRLGGTAEEEGKKIVARDEATVNDDNVWKPREAPAASNSPNAVTINLENNVLNVSRTTREPFAYHYCATVTGRGKYKFWDPLFHRAYVNGMNDYFLTYEERPDLNLSPSGPKCYVDKDDDKNRLYSFKPDQVSRTFANSSALREVQAAKGELSTDKSVYLIIDSKNWLNRGLRVAARGSRRGEINPNQHPWIVTQFFDDKPVS